VPIVINPANGEFLVTEDPAGYYQRGYRDPTLEELQQSARQEEFGSFEQQAQAQVERVVRGATLGGVEGFGDSEDIRARAEVSEELSPVTSFAASVLPDVGIAALTGGLGGLATGAGRAAGRAALAEGAGLVRAGLAASRAGGAAALAGESLGTAAVGAGQQAYAEGRELGDDPGRDAENALIWGGLNFGLGALFSSTAKSSKSLTAPKAVDDAAAELDDIAKAAEFRAAGKAEGEVADAIGSSFPSTSEAAPAAAPYDLRGMSLEDLGQRADSMRPESLERLRADEAFKASGRLRSRNAVDYDQGISLGVDPENGALRLQDGRHRLQVAREEGIPELYGTVRDLGSGEVFYQGFIPVTAGAVRQGEREAVEGGVERALRNASKADADDVVERAIGAAPEREADSFGRQRRLYINRAAILEGAEREMAQDLGGLVKDVSQVARGDKLTNIARNVSDNLTAQRAAGRGIAEDAAKFAGELKAEARAYAAASGKTGMQYAIPGQKSWTQALMDHAKEIAKAPNGRALFEALDGFKRSAQDFKLSLEAGALNSSNPIHHQKLIPKIESFAQRIRGALEDSGTWGKAGEMQRAYNAVLSDKLFPSMRVFEEAVLQRTFKGYDGVWNLEGWETKVRALLKGSDPGNRRHVGTVLDAMDELASVRRQYGDAKLAGRIEASTAKVRRTMGLADEVADATERMGAIGELVSGVPYGGAIAGGLAGGLPGAAIGAVLPGAVRGLVMGDLISAFQRLSGATDAAVARGVDDWIRSSRVRGAGGRGLLPKLPELSGEAKQLRDVAMRRGISQSMALFLGDDESPGAAFERWRDALLDQEQFFQALGEDYGTLQNEAPEVFMAVAARADLARRFLIERMPPNVAVSMANPEGYPPNRDAIEDWATYVNAVRFPTRVVQNLAGISVQEVETLRTVHPRMYELAQQRVIEGIANARASAEPLDDAFLARIGILFPELDGVGSPVFSRELGQAVRDYNMAQRQQRAAASGSGQRPQRPNPLQATIEGGATFGTAG
jgi:hypothetical protein